MTDTLKPAELDLEALKKVIDRLTRETCNFPQQIDCEGVGWSRFRMADVQALLGAFEALEAERDEALRECSKWAREAGEAVGKLETSELAGIVDGWKARALSAEAQRDRMREALTGTLNQIRLYARCNPNGNYPAILREADRALAALSQGSGEEG